MFSQRVIQKGNSFDYFFLCAIQTFGICLTCKLVKFWTSNNQFQKWFSLLSLSYKRSLIMVPHHKTILCSWFCVTKTLFSIISSKRSMSSQLSNTLKYQSSSLKRLDASMNYNEPSNLSRSKSQPKLTKSGPTHATSLSPIGKQNKWASMPWLVREPSFASSVTSEMSSQDQAYRNKYRSERQEHKDTINAYTDLQDEFTNQAKELAEAKQTIDQLRLGATIDLFGKPPEPGTLIQGSLPQSFEQSAFNPPKVIQETFFNDFFICTRRWHPKTN